MRLPRLRFTIGWMMLTTAVIAFFMVLVVRAHRAGRLIEELRSPIRVVSWSEQGLQLGDGRTVRISDNPIGSEMSTALAEATREGIELSPDRRVYSLVRVHHWCGNDPVREHVARVDLAGLLTFLGPTGKKLIPGV